MAEEAAMTGARQIALDYIRPHLRTGLDVLDLCCGDDWLRGHVLSAGGHWTGVDHRGRTDLHRGRILADIQEVDIPGMKFDLVASVYGTQHMLHHEHSAWGFAHAGLKQDGSFLVIARYRQIPGREMDRQDPLNGHNEESLTGLALATGFAIVEFRAFRYEGNVYTDAAPAIANAFAATLRKF